MLVLTRKLQQQIKIGDEITVTILRVKGQTVRVGIDAPREVRVIRGELPREGANQDAEANAGATEALESTIIEARITLVDDDTGTSSDAAAGEAAATDSQDDTVMPRGQSAGLLNRCVASPVAPCMPLPLRLPQRKRFSRTDNPPLRVAHQSTTSLAK